MNKKKKKEEKRKRKEEEERKRKRRKKKREKREEWKKKKRRKKKNKIKSPSPEIQGWVLDFFRFATISVRFSLFSRKLYAIFFIFFAKSVPF